MGTNYYAVRNRPTTDEPIHIGKSSFGWRFLFQAQNDNYREPPVVWKNYEEVKDWLYKHTVVDKDFVIMNEYDEVVSFNEFFELVEAKQEERIHDEHASVIEGYRFETDWFC